MNTLARGLKDVGSNYEVYRLQCCRCWRSRGSDSWWAAIAHPSLTCWRCRSSCLSVRRPGRALPHAASLRGYYKRASCTLWRTDGRTTGVSRLVWQAALSAPRCAVCRRVLTTFVPNKLSFPVASLGRTPPRVTPSREWHTNEKNVAEFTKNSGETRSGR